MTVLSVIATIAFFLMPQPTALYSDAQTAICELPAGYFVLACDTTAPDGFIAVRYDDITGYVKSAEVSAVDFTPVTKYETTATVACDNDGQPVNLRSAPKKSASVVRALESNAVGRYYGTIEGDAIIKDCGTTWYYCDFDGIKGYCYYAHVSAQAQPPNIIEKEDPVSTDPVNPETPSTQKPFSDVTAIIFIAALCLPVPFIMYYLFRKPKQ